MPVHFTINKDRFLVEFVIDGKISIEELQEAVEQRFNHPEYEEGMGALWDATLADFSLIDAHVLRDHALWSVSTGVFRKAGSMAVIAPDDVIFGVYRAGLSQTSPNAEANVRIFRDRATAEAWIAQNNKRPD